MSAHIFWPPLAVLSMGVMIIIFLILKYGDKLFKARTTPRQQPLEFEMESSENTAYDEEGTFEDYDEQSIEEEPAPDQEKNLMEIIPVREKYEYAV